jgi:hypothetical protein
LIKRLEDDLKHKKELEAEVETLRTIKTQQEETYVKLESAEQEV